MQIGEVDHIAEADAIDDVAERAAEHEAERQRVVAALFAPHPEDDERRCAVSATSSQRRVSLSAVRKPIETPRFSTQRRSKNRQQLDLAALLQLERVGDDPLGQLIEQRRRSRRC
jgi:hypothetical protein